MEKKPSDKTKPETKKVRLDVNAPLAGDLNGCVLVIPQAFRRNKYIMLYQGALSEYQL
jgi:hypothetical protein